jgi:hypothetical protein
MANQLSPFRKKVSLALKVETVAKLDKRAAMDNTSRAAVVEYFLSAALDSLELTPEEMAKVKAEIEANKTKKARG